MWYEFVKKGRVVLDPDLEEIGIKKSNSKREIEKYLKAGFDGHFIVPLWGKSPEEVSNRTRNDTMFIQVETINKLGHMDEVNKIVKRCRTEFFDAGIKCDIKINESKEFRFGKGETFKFNFKSKNINEIQAANSTKSEVFDSNFGENQLRQEFPHQLGQELPHQKISKATTTKRMEMFDDDKKEQNIEKENEIKIELFFDEDIDRIRQEYEIERDIIQEYTQIQIEYINKEESITDTENKRINKIIEEEIMREFNIEINMIEEQNKKVIEYIKKEHEKKNKKSKMSKINKLKKELNKKIRQKNR